MIPHWLTILSRVSLVLGFSSAAVIVAHESRHPQKMWIMNAVWALTALYASLLGLWAYFAIGRTLQKDSPANANGAQSRVTQDEPTWRQIAVSDSHCAAGCTLGDIVGESAVFAFGWSFFGQTLYADYAVTLVLAWVFGIVFQYFNIKPMKHLSAGHALVKSAQADTLSILFFQLGMYAWMAVAYFALFAHPHLRPNTAAYWFFMQIGMLLGFATAYPVNEWLLRTGVKEAMG